MTILDEGKLIRSEVAKLRPDKRRRYPDPLRARILHWVDRATASGMTEPECSHLIAVKTWRFVMWRREVARRKATEATPLALVPIHITGRPTSTTMAVITPSGHRVEGLTLAEVTTLLRELA